MDLKGSLFAAGFITFGSLLTFLILRRTSGGERISRAPLLLTCSLPLFYMGIANLPVIFEPLFTKAIGHSIWDTYHFPKAANGVEFSQTWWVARWLGPIQKAVCILVALGIVWALINAARGRQRVANTIGAVVGIALFMFALWINATIGQLF